MISRSGGLKGYLWPGRTGHIGLRLRQYELHSDTYRSMRASRRVVESKLEAMSGLLTHYSHSEYNPAAKESARRIIDNMSRLKECLVPQRLMGMEGQSTRLYWEVFQSLNRSAFSFNGRRKRPPPDPINAMLSFGYTLLACELRAMLESLGLDPYLGFYHVVTNHRPGLVLDVMEPLRHVVVDRMVLRAINLGQVRPEHFELKGNGRCQLTRDGLYRFIDVYEHAMLKRPDLLLKDRFPDHSVTRQAIYAHCRQIVSAFSPQPNQPPDIDRESRGDEERRDAA